MTKKKKIIIISISSAVILSLSLAVGIPFIVLSVKTNNMDSDYSYLRNDEHYSKNVSVDGVNLIKQDVTCGYACIEMMSSYYGSGVTESELYKRNHNSITTSSSDGFLKEINKSIPNYEFIKHSYLKHDVLLKEIHDSLSSSHPVCIEWAALYNNQEWTLHYSVVTGIDLSNDSVTIYNPYGYIENINIDEFINRTSFKAYKNIPFYLSFGFAYGAFEKNVFFMAKR